MKIKRKMSKAALTTLICLTLSSSAAFAMPSGGTQVQGDVSVSSGSLSAVANGATITANGNSIINWQDFGIKNNEKLTIDTTNGALLNRVTGGKVSELLGNLTQQGKNPMLLVIPMVLSLVAVLLSMLVICSCQHWQWIMKTLTI